jgi:lysozyme
MKTLIGVLIFTAVLLAGVAWYFSRRYTSVKAVDVDAREFPVRGLDLSAHNGNIDFELLARDSIDFVMLKATEGTNFKDPRFHLNYMEARRAGIKAIGAYHFFRFDTDGEMQALNFLNSIKGKTLDMPAVIDLEEWTNPKQLDTEQIVTRIKAMIKLLERNGINVMFYTNKDGYRRFIQNRFDDYPLWICSFNNPPLDKKDGHWDIWQYTHWGWSEACNTNVDINTFNGSREEWLNWLRLSTF